jgi:hypothetical protein
MTTARFEGPGPPPYLLFIAAYACAGIQNSLLDDGFSGAGESRNLRQVPVNAVSGTDFEIAAGREWVWRRSCGVVYNCQVSIIT